MDDLINLLERINKFPLTPEERADLMRAVIEQRQAHRPRGGTSSTPLPSRVLDVLRAGGDWMRPRDIAAQLGTTSSPVSIALKSLVTSGAAEVKTDDSDATLPNGRAIRWYRIAAAQ